ncbi:MAG: DUF3667 domain-containing protein [Pseudomonadota bacterium]|nr:DUF3667 domain-containing protein [Pseudomonadota bacterium]MDQ3160806.1 DUF3667 domain-containing protein [Pseudomonadota bacterium]
MTTANDTMPEPHPLTPPPPAERQAEPPVACGNCNTPLLGPHCHACGQPVKGLVRHFSSVAGDALDTVFNFDTRTVRTIVPLFAKPGVITLEYLAGRRVCYVSPVRLFFFLAIITFFVAQHSFGADIKVDDNGGIASAMTVAEVEAKRDIALAGINEARKTTGSAPGATIGVEFGEDSIRDAAEGRIKALRDAQRKGLPPPKSDSGTFNIGDVPWDAKTNPIAITWLPGFANDWLNEQAGRANSNAARLKENPAVFRDAALGAVPTTLFVLVPVFALMLKFAYAFKRRLYMEHLIVALHSHAFLCLDLLLVLVVGKLESWLAPEAGALNTLFAWTKGLLLAWMPIYLLVMQKRVYAQGWPMTLLKYFVLGTCYSVLLSVAILASGAIGLLAM